MSELRDKLTRDNAALRTMLHVAREALRDVAVATACKCHADYTRRALHEPNALCYLGDLAEMALSLSDYEVGNGHLD